MANAVSLLTAAPLDCLVLSQRIHWKCCLMTGMISSGISESATFHQHCQVSRLLPSLSWKNQSRVTVLLAPGFYNENHEISLPNKRNCAVDGSGSYSSCRVISCVPATSCACQTA
ncbi:hypothetical protein PF003_g1190 [Phytophthora fragariae]|nr:hypothetical protein PF003_g1190 [Phytophthora fragariae]